MSNVLFSGDVASLNGKEIEELLGSLKVKLDHEMSLLDLLVTLGAAPSKTQAKTFILQNSVAVNGEKCADPAKIITKDMAIEGKYIVLRRGKKNYFLGAFEKEN